MFPIANLEELVSNIEIYREINCIARLITSEGPAYPILPVKRMVSGTDRISNRDTSYIGTPSIKDSNIEFWPQWLRNQPVAWRTGETSNSIV